MNLWFSQKTVHVLDLRFNMFLDWSSFRTHDELVDRSSNRKKKQVVQCSNVLSDTSYSKSLGWAVLCKNIS